MARLTLFDAHCHLQDKRVVDCAPLLIKQASEAGVRWFAVNGTCEDDWEAVKTMSESHKSVIPNFGLHPWFIPGRSSKWLSVLREKLESTPTAAVGEIGMDLGARGREVDESLQREVMKEQLQLARELNRPASIHCVRAMGPIQSLIAEMGTFPSGLIMHSFPGPADAVRDLVKHGAYISFSGFLIPMKETKARAIVKQVPLDRILLETDAPDALPKVDRELLSWIPGDPAAPSCEGSSQDDDSGSSKSPLNHPTNIRAVLNYVSKLLGISEDELSRQSEENARRIFSFQGSKVSC